MAFLFAAVRARVDAISSSVSRAAAEFGVVSSRDFDRVSRRNRCKDEETHKTGDVCLSDLLNGILHLVQRSVQV